MSEANDKEIFDRLRNIETTVARIDEREAIVAAAERSAANKPPSIADAIRERARTEAMTITNGVDTVTNEIEAN